MIKKMLNLFVGFTFAKNSAISEGRENYDLHVRVPGVCIVVSGSALDVFPNTIIKEECIDIPQV